MHEHCKLLFLFWSSEGCGKLSLERILKALVSLGLSQVDAQIYIYLATEGPVKARNIINSLTINEREVYRSLKRLQNKGIIIANDECLFLFSAVTFEDVIDLLMEIKKEQAQALKESRKEVLSSWRKIVEENSEKS
jgi:sugar-specific transcriptional regulator TrmB